MKPLFMGFSELVEPQNKQEANAIAQASLQPEFGNIYVDIENLKNPMAAIVGSSGTGKTTLINRLARDISEKNPCHVISFHGDMDAHNKADIIKIGGDGRSINLLEAPKETLDAELIVFASKVVERMALPKLGYSQRSMLEKLIVQVLEQSGMPDGNGFYVQMKEIGVEDLVTKLEVSVKEAEANKLPSRQVEIINSLILKLRPLANSNAFRADRYIDYSTLMDKSVVFDLSELSALHKGIVSSSIVRVLIDQKLRVEEARRKTSFIIVDEFQHLLATDKNVVSTLFKELRKEKLGVIVATQDYSLLRKKDLGVLNNASILISLANNDMDEARAICRNTGFFLRNITGVGCGRGSMKIAYSHGDKIMRDMVFVDRPNHLRQQQLFAYLNQRKAIEAHYQQELARKAHEDHFIREQRRQKALQQAHQLAYPPPLYAQPVHGYLPQAPSAHVQTLVANQYTEQTGAIRSRKIYEWNESDGTRRYVHETYHQAGEENENSENVFEAAFVEEGLESDDA